MDAETQRWAWGIAITVVLMLIGCVFKMLWSEIKRVAKNLHDLRAEWAPWLIWIQIFKERQDKDDEKK